MHQYGRGDTMYSRVDIYLDIEELRHAMHFAYLLQNTKEFYLHSYHIVFVQSPPASIRQLGITVKCLL